MGGTGRDVGPCRKIYGSVIKLEGFFDQIWPISLTTSLGMLPYVKIRIQNVISSGKAYFCLLKFTQGVFYPYTYWNVYSNKRAMLGLGTLPFLPYPVMLS